MENPALALFDPMTSAIVGDGHKSNDVRRGLQPMVNLSVKYDIASLGITHFRKGSQGSNPAERVIDSVAYTAAPRLTTVAIKAADGTRRWARAKANNSPDGDGFEYELVQCHVREPGSDDLIEAQRIKWGKKLTGTARARSPRRKRPRPRPERETCLPICSPTGRCR
jgi:putative DNA primase/helicase